MRCTVVIYLLWWDLHAIATDPGIIAKVQGLGFSSSKIRGCYISGGNFTSSNCRVILSTCAGNQTWAYLTRLSLANQPNTSTLHWFRQAWASLAPDSSQVRVSQGCQSHPMCIHFCGSVSSFASKNLLEANIFVQYITQILWDGKAALSDILLLERTQRFDNSYSCMPRKLQFWYSKRCGSQVCHYYLRKMPTFRLVFY
jgi:hypothetical protein